MATSSDYMEFVRECISPYGELKTRKMFGEYAGYIDGKFIMLICDDCVFIKKLPELTDIMHSAPCGFPYDGAKEHYILDIEDRELLGRLMPSLIELSSPPKKKTKKAKPNAAN